MVAGPVVVTLGGRRYAATSRRHLSIGGDHLVLGDHGKLGKTLARPQLEAPRCLRPPETVQREPMKDVTG